MLFNIYNLFGVPLYVKTRNNQIYWRKYKNLKDSLKNENNGNGNDNNNTFIKKIKDDKHIAHHHLIKIENHVINKNESKKTIKNNKRILKKATIKK